MKTITTPFALVLILFSALLQINLAFAQDDREAILKQIEEARSVGQADWKEIVALNLTLSETEASGFWPLYDDYRAAMVTLNDRLVKLITEYADSYVSNGLTEDKAKALIKEYLSIKEKEVNIRKKFLKKFYKVLPAQKVMVFYQIENKLTSLINAALALEIPLAKMM